jgi:hypothetical protein
MSGIQRVRGRPAPSADMAREFFATPAGDGALGSLYTLGAVAAIAALAANLLDVGIGFGTTDVVAPGSMAAAGYFALFQRDWFGGLYLLGILNIVYMAALMPVYLALFSAHRRTSGWGAALALIVALMGMAIYVANNAAIPMLALAEKHGAAGTEAERALYVAAGEAVLARGEDFTPGAFVGMLLSGLAAVVFSLVMLRGGVFGRATAWVGLVGFGFLSIFTLWATFIPVFYTIAFYLFGMLGGLLALAWFGLVARRLFKLARTA